MSKNTFKKIHQYRLRNNEIHKFYDVNEEKRYLKLLKKDEYTQEQKLTESDYVNIMNQMKYTEIDVKLAEFEDETDTKRKFVIEEHENLDIVVDSVLYPCIHTFKTNQKIKQKMNVLLN